MTARLNRLKVSLLLLLCSLVVPGWSQTLQQAGPKVFFAPPRAGVKALVQRPDFVLFEGDTFLKTLYLLPGGRLLVGDGHFLEVTGPDFTKRGRIDKVAEALQLKAQDGAYDCCFPSPDGKQAVVGFKVTSEPAYVFATLDLATFALKRRLQITAPEQLPGGGLTQQAAGDPEVARMARRMLFGQKHFLPVYFAQDQVVYFDYPEYGMSHGRAFLANLAKGTVKQLNAGVDTLYAYLPGGGLLYRPESDQRKLLAGEAVLSERLADYPASFAQGKVWFIEQAPQSKRLHLVCAEAASGKRLWESDLPADLESVGKLLAAAPAGGRVFLTAKRAGANALFAYVPEASTLVKLTPEPNADTIPCCRVCAGGEFFAYLTRNHCRVGYLPDETAPVIEASLAPLWQGKAYKAEVKLTAITADLCFTSGLVDSTPKLEVNVQVVQDFGHVPLKVGTNILVLTARDRAGNEGRKVLEVERVVPEETTLKAIGAEPRAFAGKLVALEGLAWGWAVHDFTKAQAAYKQNKPFLPHNLMRTRSDGNFADATATAYFPAPPTRVEWVRVIAEVKVTPEGEWFLAPVEVVPLPGEPKHE